MTPTMSLTRVALAGLLIGAGACDYDIQNPNSPTVIGENPAPSQVAAAASIPRIHDIPRR